MGRFCTRPAGLGGRALAQERDWSPVTFFLESLTLTVFGYPRGPNSREHSGVSQAQVGRFSIMRAVSYAILIYFWKKSSLSLFKSMIFLPQTTKLDIQTSSTIKTVCFTSRNGFTCGYIFFSKFFLP